MFKYVFWIVFNFVFFVIDAVNGVRYLNQGNIGMAIFEFILAGFMIAIGLLWIYLFQTRTER